MANVGRQAGSRATRGSLWDFPLQARFSITWFSSFTSSKEIGRVAWRSVEDDYQRKVEGYGERLEPISSLPLSDLLMLYHVLDVLDDSNSIRFRPVGGLVLDGSEWPCAVPGVRIVIDEYPGVALEQELEPVDGAGRLSGRGLEDQGESSNAGHHDGQRVGTAGQVNQAAEPTLKEVLEAMQAMGTQILALTQSLAPIRTAIPIGNERIAPVVAAQAAGRAAQAAGRAAQNQVEEVAEVIEEIGRVAWRSVEDDYQRKGEGYGERLEPISSLPLYDLLMFYHVLDVLDDSNSIRFRPVGGLILDGSEWPCAVPGVRIVIDEYPGVAVCLVN
ncbi:hypothetical protein Bca101_057753 [Brassica carinata]